jgi:hypothetical protein
MDPAGTIALALFLTIFGVAFFWYIWVRAFEWELAIWYHAIINRRKEREIEAMAAGLEMGGSVAGGSKAPSKKSGGEGGSKSPSKHGSKKSGGEGGSKVASKKSGSKSGGGSKHDSKSENKG